MLRTTDPNLFGTGPTTYINRDIGEVFEEGGPTLGQPVVWFLDLPTADSANHGLTMGPVISPAQFDKRSVRITVEVRDARRWLDWLKARKHDAKWVQVIVSAGGGKSAAHHWYVVPRPVLRAEWVEVRDMRTGEVVA